MVRFLVFASLVLATFAEDCKWYLRVEDDTCAESCIASTVGVCPRSLIVSAGKLTAGRCSDSGYTTDKGSLDQKAGPCGTLHFEQYTKAEPVYTPFTNVTKLATFDGKPGLTYDWTDMNDPVMGGASTSTFKIENDLGVFNGTCAIVSFLHAPGFAKIDTAGYNPLKRDKFPDVSAFLHGGVQLRVRSTTPEYKGFRFGFAAENVPRTTRYGGGSFKAGFELEDTSDFQIVRIPFTEFSYDWSPFTGRCDSKDPTGQQHHCCSSEDDGKYCPTAKYLSTLTGLELWAEGVEGDFHLEIDWIGVGI